jgi:hypothetical protein
VFIISYANHVHLFGQSTTGFHIAHPLIEAIRKPHKFGKYALWSRFVYEMSRIVKGYGRCAWDKSLNAVRPQGGNNMILITANEMNWGPKRGKILGKLA